MDNALASTQSKIITPEMNPHYLRVVGGWESPVEDASPLSEIIKWKL
jgi:hypothetical protein